MAPRAINTPLLGDVLALPAGNDLALLPDEQQQMFATGEGLDADATSAIQGAQAVAASAREDFDIAKTALANAESRSVLPGSGVTKADLTALRGKVDRARERLNKADAAAATPIGRRTAIRATVAAMTRRVERARTFAPTHNARTDRAQWVTGGGSKLAGFDFRLVPVDLPRGDPLDVVTSQQRASKDLRLERESVRASVSPRSSVEARLRADFEAAAERGALDVDIGEEGVRYPSVLWPTTTPKAPLNADGSRVQIIDTAALFVRMHRNELWVDVEAKLDAIYGAEDVLILDPAERAKRLRDINAKLVELERVEAAATWKAIEAGADIWFRNDISVDAVLGIA
jgi:hypothetical protein